MAKQVTLVAGDVSDETIAWFKAHGATVEGFGLVTITLPESALVHKGNRGWDFSVSFYNADGNDEDSYANIELSIDAYETQIRVEYNGDRQCTCKGKGCAECVEELASIARGENPYAHHTSVKERTSLHDVMEQAYLEMAPAPIESPLSQEEIERNRRIEQSLHDGMDASEVDALVNVAYSPAFTVGDLVHITAGYYTGRDAQIAGRVYEDPGNHRPVCLVSLLGEKGASVVAAVADIEPGEAQPHRARQQRIERLEDSTEYLNDVSGRNQEVLKERAQEAAQPSDAEIEATADLAQWPGYNHAFYADGTDLDGAVLGD